MSCTLCPLHATCLTVQIDGRGSATPDIMVVCEAPGKEEDCEGAVLIGRSGKKLDEMLHAAGIDPATVYKTNAVRCRPPGNRKPMPEEVDACRTHLREEILRLRPRVIVAMGDVAIRSLLKRSGVTDKRGKAFPLHADIPYQTDVYVTYHPAFALRQPMATATIVGDLRKAKDGLTPTSEIEWKAWEGETYDLSDMLAYDIETDIKTGQVTQIAFAAPERVTTVENAHPLLAAKEVLEGRTRQIIGHNSWVFDSRVLREHGVNVPLGDDTLTLAYLLDETQPKGLEALCVKYLKVRGWKEDRDAPVGSDLFAAYNARDALYTLRLYERLFEELDAARWNVYQRILKPARYALDACSTRGIYINPSAVDTAERFFKERIEESLVRARGLVGREDWKPSSTRAVGEALEAEGHSLPRTSTGQLATGRAVLNGLQRTPLVEALLDFRNAQKAYTAFVKPYKKIVEESPDGRAHPTYSLTRTVTGRTSAQGPNTQQLPRDPLLRAFFSAPEGHERVSFDYTAIEFYVATFLAGEEETLNRLRGEGFDPHRWLASRFYGIPEKEVTSDQRTIAKSANFGLLYMGTPFTLVEYAAKTGVDLNDDEAKALYNTFHTSYPRFRQWYNSTLSYLRHNGFVQTLTGRRRHIGTGLTGKELGAAWRECVNFQVQSLAADIALTALSKCHEEGLPITDFWHDSVGFEFEGQMSENTEKRIKKIMTTDTLEYLDSIFNTNLTDIPLKVKAERK